MRSRPKTAEHMLRATRRRFVKMAVFASVSLPLAMRMASHDALAAEKLSEDDPTAVSLGYKHDAARTTHQAYVAGRNCAGCTFFQGKDAPEGPCPVFGGKLVNANGWCASWLQRG